MSVITIETESEGFYRMFEVTLKNSAKPINFKLPADFFVFNEIALKIPVFIHCEVCDKNIAELDGNWLAGAWICSKCKKETITECVSCGYPMIDLSEYPDNGVDKNDARLKHNRTHRYRGKEQYLCENCVSRLFTVCDSCGSEILQNEAKFFGTSVYCAQCANDKFKPCQTCGTLHIKEQLINGTQCSVCFQRANQIQPAQINGYGHKPRPVFISLKASGMLPYYGIELEMDGGNRSNNYLKQLARFKEIYLKSDGSLSSRGVELVTYPLNLEYHLNSMKWTEIISICESDGYKSHNTNNCGLHIHAGRNAFGESQRNQSKYLAYFLRLFMKFRAQISKFSRRTDFSYCEFYSRYNLNEKSTRAYQSYVYYNQSHRNLAVNFLNENTVEIRVFRGTLNKIALLAAIGLVDALIKMAVSVKTEEEINAFQWADVRRFAIPELISYLDKKGL